METLGDSKLKSKQQMLCDNQLNEYLDDFELDLDYFIPKTDERKERGLSKDKRFERINKVLNYVDDEQMLRKIIWGK